VSEACHSGGASDYLVSSRHSHVEWQFLITLLLW